MSGVSLPAFLLARIQEDEELAAELLAYERPIFAGGDISPVLSSALYASKRGDNHARIPTSRILAECEAKRRIIAIYEAAELGAQQWLEGRRFARPTEVNALREVAAALVLPYAGHPDCDPAWLP
jgi:hypothetical protein